MGDRDTAAVVLASGGRVDTAATAAGVDRATVYRWMREPDFAGTLTEARRVALTEAVAGLAGGAADAAHRLVTLATDPATPPHIALAAARSVLDALMRYGWATDLEARITALEENHHGE